MQYWAFVILFFLTVSCAHYDHVDPSGAGAKYSSPTPKGYSVENRNLKKIEEVDYDSTQYLKEGRPELHGKLASVTIETENSEFAPKRNLIKTLLKGYLTQRGFQLVDDVTKAHLWIDVKYVEGSFATKKRLSNPTDTTLSSRTNTILNGSKKSVSLESWFWGGRLTIHGIRQSFGKRPLPYFYVGVRGHLELMSDREKLKTELLSSLNLLKFSAPSENVKMAGDPGCAPRFGFEGKSIRRRDGSAFLIEKVIKNSPAYDTKLLVGDIILAIDHRPFVSGKFKEVYEKKIRVPVKYLRDGVIERSMIRSRVMCRR